MAIPSSVPSPRPLIAISMGDPGGVGPEVALKALLRPEVSATLSPVVIGNADVIEQVACLVAPGLRIVPVATAAEARVVAADGEAGGAVPVLTVGERPRDGFSAGKVDAANGRAAYAAIVEAARLVLDGQADAICTAPISKEAMFAAGFDFPGHTELLASLCGGADVRMMLEGGGLRVVLHTIHVALSKVPALVTTDSVAATLRVAGGWAERFGSSPSQAPPVGSMDCLEPIKTDAIGVCGLNPHAGEGGHFGREDLDEIAPAIDVAREEMPGLGWSGPHPADTAFHRMRQGDFGLVVAMYHDQALIPVKTLDFHGGVNVTIGLPIVRTSPDHGTAFNLAGQGVADERSMAAALSRAAALATASRNKLIA